MLGMYFDLCLQSMKGVCASGKKTTKESSVIHDLIQQEKARMFPATYDYVTASGGTVKKELFGSLIARVDRMVIEEPQKMLDMHHIPTSSRDCVTHAAHKSAIGIVVP